MDITAKLKIDLMAQVSEASCAIDSQIINSETLDCLSREQCVELSNIVHGILSERFSIVDVDLFGELS